MKKRQKTRFWADLPGADEVPSFEKTEKTRKNGPYVADHNFAKKSKKGQKRHFFYGPKNPLKTLFFVIFRDFWRLRSFR